MKTAVFTFQGRVQQIRVLHVTVVHVTFAGRVKMVKSHECDNDFLQVHKLGITCVCISLFAISHPMFNYVYML